MKQDLTNAELPSPLLYIPLKTPTHGCYPHPNDTSSGSLRNTFD